MKLTWTITGLCFKVQLLKTLSGIWKTSKTGCLVTTQWSVAFKKTNAFFAFLVVFFRHNIACLWGANKNQRVLVSSRWSFYLLHMLTYYRPLLYPRSFSLINSTINHSDRFTKQTQTVCSYSSYRKAWKLFDCQKRILCVNLEEKSNRGKIVWARAPFDLKGVQ